MLQERRLNSRGEQYVVGPTGTPLTLRDLPPAETNRWVIRRILDLMDVQRVVHPRLRLLVRQSIASVAAPEWLLWFRDQIVQRNLVRLRPLLQFQLAEVRSDAVDGLDGMDLVQLHAQAA